MVFRSQEQGMHIIRELLRTGFDRVNHVSFFLGDLNFCVALNECSV